MGTLLAKGPLVGLCETLHAARSPNPSVIMARWAAGAILHRANRQWRTQGTGTGCRCTTHLTLTRGTNNVPQALYSAGQETNRPTVPTTNPGPASEQHAGINLYCPTYMENCIFHNLYGMPTTSWTILRIIVKILSESASVCVLDLPHTHTCAF